MDNTNYGVSFNKPFIGIFMKKTSINRLMKGKHIPTISPFEIANKQKQLTLYYFSMDDINLKKKLIKGTFYNTNKNKWDKQYFAYPDILYKRCHPSKKEKKDFKIFSKHLSKINSQPLNLQNSFNKWEVIQNLSKYPTLLSHLPETILYNDPQDLEKMLNKHQKVYLKGCYGGRGRQVIAVTKLTQGGFRYSLFVGKLYIFEVETFDDLLLNIMNFYKQRPFIIQAAIDLIQIEDRLVDLRPEVQRNGKNQIVIAGLPVRIGKKAAPITTHAESYNFEEFFRKFMYYPKDKISLLKEQITSFVTTIYQHLELDYGPCGELGIDIGLDKNNRLWFIECNSRSRKVSFFNTYDNDAINQSFINLLEYAQYLYSKRGKI